MMGRISASDIITVQNGLRQLQLLQTETVRALEEKERLLLTYYTEQDKKTVLRKGYEERKEYSEEMLAILAQIRQSVGVLSIASDLWDSH